MSSQNLTTKQPLELYTLAEIQSSIFESIAELSASETFNSYEPSMRSDRIMIFSGLMQLANEFKTRNTISIDLDEKNEL